MYKPSALSVQRVAMTPAEIRRLRERLCWTQARFAVVILVHRSTVSRWERGCRRHCAASARRLDMIVSTAKRTHAVRALRKPALPAEASHAV